MTHVVVVTAVVPATADAKLVEAVGARLDDEPALVDPILSLIRGTGVLEMNVEVEAPGADVGRRLAIGALARAISASA